MKSGLSGASKVRNGRRRSLAISSSNSPVFLSICSFATTKIDNMSLEVRSVHTASAASTPISVCDQDGRLTCTSGVVFARWKVVHQSVQYAVSLSGRSMHSPDHLQHQASGKTQIIGQTWPPLVRAVELLSTTSIYKAGPSLCCAA